MKVIYGPLIIAHKKSSEWKIFVPKEFTQK